jgi:integrase
VLTFDIAEKWIRHTDSESNAHMSRRVRTMKHLGEYQLSIGKPAYIPNYAIHRNPAEEPHLFSDEQLKRFFAAVDSKIKATEIYPNNNVILPVFFRMIYSCGLRASEACNLKMEDVDLERGTLTIYGSKGLKVRALFMSDDLKNLCRHFNAFYNGVIPVRNYFFQPSLSRERYCSGDTSKFFDSILKKASLCDVPGKKFTQHGLRHLFAVQNIKKCAECGEDFGNWIQYLCKYMGHKHIRFTTYYLHITSQLFPVYSDKLKLLEEGIGVVYAEE